MKWVGDEYPSLSALIESMPLSIHPTSIIEMTIEGRSIWSPFRSGYDPWNLSYARCIFIVMDRAVIELAIIIGVPRVVIDPVIEVAIVKVIVVGLSVIVL